MKVTNFDDISGHFVQDKSKAMSTIDLTAFLHKHQCQNGGELRFFSSYPISYNLEYCYKSLVKCILYYLVVGFNHMGAINKGLMQY